MPKLFAQLQRRFRPEVALGRRDFLKATAAAGAGLLLSNRWGFAQPASGRKVVVIGAGFGCPRSTHPRLIPVSRANSVAACPYENLPIEIMNQPDPLARMLTAPAMQGRTNYARAVAENRP